MKLVRCIKHTPYQNTKVGEVYRVIGGTRNTYLILNDKGHARSISSDCFIQLSFIEKLKYYVLGGM